MVFDDAKITTWVLSTGLACRSATNANETVMLDDVSWCQYNPRIGEV